VSLTEKKPETREEKAEGAPQIKVVGPPPKDEEAEAARREAEEIRRRKLEAGQQALSSSLMIKCEGPKPATASDDQTTASPECGGRPYTPAGPDAYAPAADQDKEAFFIRADAAQWLSPYTREAGRKYELKTGTVIPGVMVSGINSESPRQPHRPGQPECLRHGHRPETLDSPRGEAVRRL
jgi:type IV secretion system protein VirB10